MVVLVEGGLGTAIRRTLKGFFNVGLPARKPYISGLTSPVRRVRLMNVGMALDRLVRGRNGELFACTVLSTP